MYDAGVSVQQSGRASSQSRASVSGRGCNYDDKMGDIVQARRRSVGEGIINANRHAKERTRDGERAMEEEVEAAAAAAAGNTKLRLA